MSTPDLSLAAAFAAGLVTSASPCVLAAVPVAVGFVGGQGRTAGRAWLLSLSFVLGMNLALVALGLMAAQLGLLFGTLPGPWMVTVGLMITGLALWLIWGNSAVCQVSLSLRWQQAFANSGFTGALVLGALIGTVMSPCSTPALVAALALAGSGSLLDDSVWLGAAMLLAYGLGHGVLLFLAGAVPALTTSWLRRTSAWQAWMPGRRIFGLILAAAGLWWVAQGIGMV
jgi:cytochrome c biogenesis protein CcdA